jgi:Spy/CpxP family protein refolding chaperone
VNETEGSSGLGRRWWRVGPRATAGIVVAVAFIVGGLAGASLFREFGRGEREGRPRFLPGMKLAPAASATAGDGREPGEASERALARFARALQLTPAQAAAVERISAHEFDAANAVREESWPRMQSVLDDTRHQIDSVLTPVQRTRYHDMLARQEERWRREQARRAAESSDSREPKAGNGVKK